MTPASNRPVPTGYTEHWDFTIWNVGHVYLWSDVYRAWMKCGRCTVKPGQVLGDAFEAWAGHSMWLDYSIFFVEEGCDA